MINMLINELVAYGTRVHLVEEADKVYITNSLLELFEQMEFSECLVHNKNVKSCKPKMYNVACTFCT